MVEGGSPYISASPFRGTAERFATNPTEDDRIFELAIPVGRILSAGIEHNNEVLIPAQITPDEIINVHSL